MDASHSHKKQEHADVRLFPPLVGLTLAVLGVVLHMLFPIRISLEPTGVFILGIFVLMAGVGLQFVCVRALKRAKTTPLFQKPTTAILKSGPYARSRNPIYIAVFLQFSGLALLLNTWWLFLVLPVLYLYLRYGVIKHEELYLEEKFGETYRTYKSEVRRWL